MRKIAGFIILNCIAFIHVFANDTAQFSLAKKYLNGVYNVMSTKQQYIKANAYTYSEKDMLHPFEKSEFIMARKGKCSYQSYNNLTSFSDDVKSLQIDTVDKTIVISQPIQAPMMNLRPDVLNQVSNIIFTDNGKGTKTMGLTFNPNCAYQKIEMTFDTSTFKLTKLNLWFVGHNDENNPELRKMEIEYLVIDDKVPNNIEVCSIDEILEFDKEKNIKIKKLTLKDYEIINLFAN